MANEILNILDSKIKKLRIELPDFKFNSSTSEESDIKKSDFVGRKQISAKLKSLIEDESKTGVYLVAGNRGVGKTRLVNKVIKEAETKNRNQIVLKLNFGHNLKDEKDILRLVARTLSIEYNKHFFLRRLLFNLIKFVFFALFFLSAIFVVDSTVELLLADLNLSNLKQLFNNIANIGLSILNKGLSILNKEISTLDIKSRTLLLLLSSLYFFVFFICLLLSRSSWFRKQFPTYRAIMRQLNKLNSDITHSTERESSVNIEREVSYIGKIGAGTKTKQSRGVADAREIEKELENILENIQKLNKWLLIRRPNIVIVFDELDKVEPSEALQTKAAMFSVNVAREKQTEILKILSNMKYFLSTAKAKFIFITGREMYDMYLERNNYIASIFNDVIYVPSFLTDYAGDCQDMTSLTEEFVCRKLIPKKYFDASLRSEKYNLEEYQAYLKIFICKNRSKDWSMREEHKRLVVLWGGLPEYIEQEVEKISEEDKRKIHKIIAVLQHLILYLAYVSKGAPKKMIQLFESFIEVGKTNENDKKKFLTVQNDDKSEFFLTFDYYRQYALGMTAYLITPIFNRLSETNIREHSDKLLVSFLRFVDFLFKFHTHTFSWKNLEVAPELLEIHRSPELKSLAVDLLNYLTQLYITKSSFSLNEYKFDSLIANEIFTMTKTDEVFSALHSFSLDETLPLKEYYKDLLDKTLQKYQNNKNSDEFMYAVISLQAVLGDLYYYDDQLEEAEMFYENTIHTLRHLARKNKEGGSDDIMTIEELYLFVRNMLKLGMIFEKRKQYDFAYLTYGELCKRIIRERNIAVAELKAGVALRKSGDKDVFVKSFTVKKTSKNKKERLDKEEKRYYDNVETPLIESAEKVDDLIATPQPLFFEKISPNTNDMLFKKMTFEGLKLLYLPFIAKLQILEKSHIGGITRNHLEQLDREFAFLTSVIDHEEAKILEADFFSQVANVLYYKNLDLLYKNGKNRQNETNDKENNEENPKNHSCTACYYYHKALSILLNEKEEKNTPLDLLKESIENIENNYNMKHCTVLARILSDWGNIFYSCDIKDANAKHEQCYICNKDCNTRKGSNSDTFIANCVKYVQSEKGDSKIPTKQNWEILSEEVIGLNSKRNIAFAMYTISSKAYTKANLYKRSAYQIYKMLRLFKSYKIYDNIEYIKDLGQRAIRSLWYATEELSVFELNKRKKDFDKKTIEDKIPLQYLLVDGEISRIGIFIKELELRMCKELSPKELPNKLKEYYGLHITSPYSINYSISARIDRLRLKSTVNYEAYQMLIKCKRCTRSNCIRRLRHNVQVQAEIEFILNNSSNDIVTKIFGFKDKKSQEVFELLVAESIFCLKEIIRLSKTMDETYFLNHRFMGLMHHNLSFWVSRYEAYSKLKKGEAKGLNSHLKYFLGKEWREELSGYYENQQALSHYYKCLEMHYEGKAYHNIIDKMCYINDDYNDRSDHFEIANERHFILNGKIDEKIKEVKESCYKDSGLYKVDNYFGVIDKSEAV